LRSSLKDRAVAGAFGQEMPGRPGAQHGTYLHFATVEGEAKLRPSLEERYKGKDDLLLPRDAAACAEHAKAIAF
jgi:hypothetical protein